MRLGGTLFRFVAACGLTAAALLACGVTAHAQTRIGSTGGTGTGTGMSSGGYGASGGFGASGSSGGFSGSSGSTSNQFSFAGGTSGTFAGSTGSFSGNTGSFSGSSGAAFSGTSGSGSYTGGGGYGGRGSTSIGGVSPMNAFASSYANPMAGGLATSSGTTTTSSAFGTPLYSNLVTNPTKIVGTASGSSGGFIGSNGGGTLGSASMRGGLSGGYGGGSGSTSGTGYYGIFALPYAVAANTPYPATPGATVQPGGAVPGVFPGGAPPVAKLTPLPARMQTDLQGLIARSDSISAATRSGITFAYDSRGNIVLRGDVASPAEARALESLLRFAPGVSGVRNELTLKGP